MKKILTLLMLVISTVTIQAHNITSTTSGGYWSSTSTWVGGVVPGSGDSATIATTGTNQVSVSSNTTILKVVVNSGANLYTNLGSLTITGLLTNNGSVKGSGAILFTLNSGTVITGSGSWSSCTANLEFTGANQVIDASVSMNRSTGAIILNTTGLGGNVKVTNYGSITLSDVNLGRIYNVNSTSYSTTWVNGAGAYVSVAVASWSTSKDTLYASASGNTVAYGGTTPITLKNPVNSTYYNLNIANSSCIHTLPNNLNCYSVTVNSGAELNTTGDSLFLSSGGTWSHPGTVINHKVSAVDTTLIKTGGTITQKIPPMAFTITSTSTAAGWTSYIDWVNGIVPGVLDTAVIATTSGYTLAEANNTVAKIIVNSGATLNLYGTVSGILINNGKITGNNFVYFTNPNGTVVKGSGDWSTYTGQLLFEGAYQVVDASATITAGEIVLRTSTLGGPIKVRNKGSITLTSHTLGYVVNNNGTYSSVWINDSNAYLKVIIPSFTNSKDTLYAGAPGNTIEYGGNSAYSMKTPKNSTYYNLTVSDTNTVSLPAALTIKNNLQISHGTLDVTASNYGLTIGGNLTNNGTFTERSGTVILNGTSAQTIGGSTTTTFYNLTVNGSTSNVVTLGGNESVSSILQITTGSVNTSTYHIN
ncbi:MAG TPA: hypothetical protein VK806_11445 [Bacteroidia bacterium]|jgi:hypothetical protein|nr:hypothetical protein [Bacteroidia bacterium]